jgi:3'-5' exoribonuclease
LQKEKFWIEDLMPNMRLQGASFLITECSVRTDVREQPYLFLKLTDRSGTVDALMWNLPTSMREEGLECPAYARIDGQTHNYRGMLQVKVEGIELLDESEVSEEDYIPATELDRRALAEELKKVGEEFEDPYLQELFGLIVADEELWEAFCAAPAAKSMHHAHIGGLLEHSVQCMRLARALTELYPVNRDLLLFGAIFHDVGKVRELSWDKGGFGYTTEGRLQGHVVLGERLVSSYVSEIADFPEELALQISHVILSHQGEPEYGSPERPKTLEAILVHFIDNMDARAAMYLQGASDVSPGGWSHHENPLGRPLYVPPEPPTA